MQNSAQLVLVATVMFFLSACDSITGSGEVDEASLDPSAYEYKGAADPLLSVPAADRAGGLADRFDLVQGRQ